MWIVRADNAYICGMTMWLPNLEGRKGPVYRAIADAIDAEVEQGTLRAGTRCRRIATWLTTSG